MLRSRFGNRAFFLGILAIAAYWWSVHPIGFPRGYGEDFFSDISRIVLSDNFRESGAPTFFSNRFMAPHGIDVPFFSWSIERDLIGTWLWGMNPAFPFLPAYFAVSLLASYLLLGLVLPQFGLSIRSAWLLSAAAVLFHIPRHFKVWHHFEYLTQHWIYASVLLEAWIWREFARNRRWSLTLEAWRAFLLVATVMGPGYYWGPMTLLWIVQRAFILAGILSYRKDPSRAIRIEFSACQAAPAFALALLCLGIEGWWFSKLLPKIAQAGTVFQGMGWFAHVLYFPRPLWLDTLYPAMAKVFGWSWQLPGFGAVETVVTVGWFLWIPALFAMAALRRSRGGPGLWIVAPFLVLLIYAMCYAAFPKPALIHELARVLVPPMKFFRVASRWGQYMPHFLLAIILLSWPELRESFRKFCRRPRAEILLCLFAISSLAELRYLTEPVSMPIPLGASAEKLLEGVRQAPGDLVLDLPFCVAGNGVCTTEQCPNYPASTVGQSFTAWHEKKVYGLYAGRLTFKDCEIYRGQPFSSWFNAWHRNRCFSEPEWDELCRYLASEPRHAAILVYPDIWVAADSPDCQAQFRKRLGPPIEEARFFGSIGRGGVGSHPMRLWRFAPQCQK